MNNTVKTVHFKSCITAIIELIACLCICMCVIELLWVELAHLYVNYSQFIVVGLYL